MPATGCALLDSFVPHPDVRERHQVTVHAPAALVMETAQNFEIESLWLVRSLFRLRAAFLGAASKPQSHLGLLYQMERIGWGKLAEESGRYFIAGATCRPWLAEPGFSPIRAESFAAFAEPNQVKIAWTLETIEIAPAITSFASETRAAATDEQARLRFRRYWRKFGAGIVLIRRVLLPAVRRRAEERWRETQSLG